MRHIENTAVNELIARASGGPRFTPAAQEALDPSVESEGAVTLRGGAPFSTARSAWRPVPDALEACRAALPASYPVTYRAPVAPGASPPPTAGPAWSEPVDPRRLYQLAMDPRAHERLVPTVRMRRRSEIRTVVARLVFPIALLVSIGIVIGAYVAFGGDAAAPAPAAPAVAAASEVRTPVLVDVRIESIPSGATVTLIDRGRSQLVGNTPIDAAIDPSREYEVVFSSPEQSSHVEHLDPRTTRRLAVALGKRNAAKPAADPTR